MHSIKSKAYTNISGNEQDDKPAKMGCTLEHKDAVATHEHAHPTPYYLQKQLVALNARHTRLRPHPTLWKIHPKILPKAQPNNSGIPNTPITQMARQQRH